MANRIGLTFICLLAMVTISLGALTRLKEAGLGCPDWPGCYGQLQVPTSLSQLAKVAEAFPGQTVEPQKAWWEMVHRYFAGTLGVLLGLFWFQNYRKRQSWPPSMREHTSFSYIVSGVLVGALLFQAILGMWTVTWKLHPIVVMGHLLGGFMIVTLLWVLLMEQVDWQAKALRSFRAFVWVGLGLITVQISLGGWVSANYASLACTDFPICEGNWHFSDAFHWLPLGHNYEGGALPTEARMALQMWHRIGGLIVLVYGLGLSFAWVIKQPTNRLKSMGAALCLLLIVQVLLGSMNVLFHLPLAIAWAHHWVASLLLCTIATMTWVVSHE